jgi:hypothetical protein
MLIDIFDKTIIQDIGDNSKSGRIVNVSISLLRDLFLVLKYAQENELKVTQTEEIYKRCINDLEELLGNFRVIDDSLFDIKQQRLDFLMRYLLKKRLLYLSGSVLAVDKDIAEDWYNLTEFRKFMDLLKFYENSVVGRDILYWFIKASTLSLKKDSWYSIRDFSKTITEITMKIKDIKKSETNKLVLTNLYVLYHFGLIDVLLTNNGNIKYFRPNTNLYALVYNRDNLFLVEENNEITIQSDFTVIARRNINLELRRKLEKFLKIERMDELIHYKMDKDSIYRAMVNGFDIDEIIGVISEFSQKEPPQNVMYSLRKWGSQYGLLQFYKGVVLCAEKEKLAEEIGIMLEKMQIEKKQLNGRCFIIDREDYKKVYDMLMDIDYLPNPLNIKSEEPDKKPDTPILERFEKRDIRNILLVLEKAIEEQREIQLRIKNGENVFEEWVRPINIREANRDYVLTYKRLDSIIEEEEKISKIIQIAW